MFIVYIEAISWKFLILKILELFAREVSIFFKK